MVVGMEIAAVVERVEAIASVHANPSPGTDLLEAGLVAVREVQAWCAAQHAGLVDQLTAIDSFPEQRIAKASKTSLHQAAKTTERSNTLKQTPTLADALGDGAITTDHIDAVTRASKNVDATKRNQLLHRADALAEVAKAATVGEFARRLDLETKRLHDDDGMDRLARQRRNVRARSWVDGDGMWNLSAKFDPITGVKLAGRIDTMMHTLFSKAVPDDCPDDPIEKQRYLSAHATARLLTGHTTQTPTTPMRATPADPNMWWSSMPTPPDSQARSPSSPSPSKSPHACSPPSPATPTSTPSWSATASSCTPPAS